MKKIMLDLETMGNKPGAAIISIGAVFFDVNNGLGREFHTRIDLEDAVKSGLKMDPSTVKWWMKQSKEAQDAVMMPGASLRSAIMEFESFVRCNLEIGERVEVWGNGSDFDNVLLLAAFDICEITPPWKFFDSRCYRTLKNLFKSVAPDPREGIHHDALDDAKFQALHAIKILQAKSLM